MYKLFLILSLIALISCDEDDTNSNPTGDGRGTVSFDLSGCYNVDFDSDFLNWGIDSIGGSSMVSYFEASMTTDSLEYKLVVDFNDYEKSFISILSDGKVQRTFVETVDSRVINPAIFSEGDNVANGSYSAELVNKSGGIKYLNVRNSKLNFIK
jgi:hypothetical protein